MPPVAFASHGHKFDGLSLTLTADQAQYEVGDTALITIHVLPADLPERKLKQLALLVKLPAPEPLALICPLTQNPETLTTPPLEVGQIHVTAELFRGGTLKLKLPRKVERLDRLEAELADLQARLADETDPKKRKKLSRMIALVEAKIRRLQEVIAHLKNPLASAELTLIVLPADSTPPVITALTPVDGATLNDPRPTISATYTDAESGIDVTSVQLTLDGADVTAQAQVSDTSISFTPASDLADGPHTATIQVADQADNQASAQTTFTIQTIVPPPITPTSGFIHGQVFDAHGHPLADARITVRGIIGEVHSGADGGYQFPTPGSGEFLLNIEKPSFTSVQRQVEVLETRDVAVEPAFLTPLDPTLTLITRDQGGLAMSSTGDDQVEFPPSAAPHDLEVRITPLHHEEQLPGPLPTGMAHLDGVFFEPRFTTFDKPVTWRHHNHKGLPPGTRIQLLLWDEANQRWLDQGTGQVTPDGHFLEFTILRFFCWYDCVLPPTPPAGAESPDSEDVTATSSEVKDTSKSCDQSVASSVCPESGDLSIDHVLPAVRTLGQRRAPIFTYRSTTASPSALIGTDYLLETESKPADAGTLVPVTTSSTVQIEGQRIEASFIGAAGKTRQAFLWDGRNARGQFVSTGAYPYTIELSNDYQTTYADTGVPTGALTPLATTITGRAIITNQRSSPFGAGWSLNGLQRLFPQPDGTALVTDGEGSATVFRPGPMLDLAVGNFSSGDVSLLFGHGDGTFQPQQRIDMTTPAISSPLPFWPAAADVNADGFQDLAVTLNRPGQVAVLLGRGGTFDPPQRLDVGIGPVFMTAGDVNHDGRIDLVVVNQASDDVSLLLGNGDGTFQPQRRLPVGRFPDSATLGDVNQDGHSDLVVANGGDPFTFTGDSLSLLLGNGDGTFQAEQRFGDGLRPHSPALADLTSDGSLDVVAVNRNGGRVHVFLGNGDGTFQPAQSFTVGPTQFAVLAVGDFNEDAIADVAVTNLNSSTMAILLGVGDGSLRAPNAFGMASASLGMAVADLNLDGHLDLAASSGTRVVSVLLGNGDGTFQRFQQFPVGADPTGIVAADFNGRVGDPDVVLTGLPGDFSILRRHPDGTWTRRLTDGIQLRFDARGFHTETVDRNGNTTTYTYDAQDRLIRLAYPGNATVNFTYDASGHLAAVTDVVGRTTQFVADGAGDLRRVTNSDGTNRQFAYDAEHRLIAQANERGFTTDYFYDTFGRLSQAILPERPVFDPATGTVSLQREVRRFTPAETLGLINTLPPGVGTPQNPAPAVLTPLSAFQDGAGNTTQLLTDHFGAPTKIIDALNRVTLIERDVNGLPTKLTRPNGSVMTMTYDVQGNLRSTREDVSQPGISFIHRIEYQFEYDPVFNQVTKITDARRDVFNARNRDCPNGCTTQMSYDANGNLVTLTDHLGNLTSLTYDNRGLLLSATDALGTATPAVPDDHQTSFTYDPTTGNLLTTTDPLSRITSLVYDGFGNVTRSTDAQLRATTFSYDTMSRLTSVLDAEGHTTRYDYDEASNLIRVTDSNNHATQFAYDSLNQLSGTTNAVSETKQFFYDANRNLAHALDAMGQAVTFSYDAGNQLTTKTLADAGGALQDTVNYAYDPLGHLTLVQDSDSKLAFLYDSIGRLILATTGDAANPAFAQPFKTVQYSYDQNSERASIAGADFTGASYVYDGLNRLLVRDEGSLADKAFEYDALSRVIRMTGGPVSTFAYDDASQVLNLNTTLLNNPLEAFAYTYDPVGNRTRLSDRFGLHQYDYDALSRLTRADHPGASQLVDETFTYDAVGNRLTSHLSTAHVHDAANRLLEDDTFTYTYDANGNRTSITDKLTGATTTYTYDVDHQLVTLHSPLVTAQYRYDGLGRRIEKAVAGTITRYVYDQEDILATYTGTNCWQSGFFHGPGIDHPLGLIRDDSGDCTVTDAVGFREPLRSLQTDGLGSLTSLVSETSGFFRALFLAERYTYDAFGSPRITGPGPDNVMDTGDDVTLPQSAFGNLYFFTGREYDPESGLYYYRARYYDPRTGRFLQEDPRAFEGGINFYEYVGNNPVNFKDPLGLYGTNSCEYYKKRCAEAGGNYYCIQAQFFCERFPKYPDPDPARDDDFEGWSRCVRQCLQDCDARYPRLSELDTCPASSAPDPRTDEFTDWQHTTCHVTCYTTCGGRRNPQF